MGGAPNTSANLSCLGLKWHANFWEPRSGQLPVSRQTGTETQAARERHLYEYRVNQELRLAVGLRKVCCARIGFGWIRFVKQKEKGLTKCL
jgi:hypothetical protein